MSEGSGRETSVLVTGGCGYIGSALVPQLLADERVDDVVVLDSLSSGSPANLAGSIRDDLRFRRGDVREYGAVEDAVRSVDAVIHLAAITGAASTHDRKAETFAVNRDGTENVLTAAGSSTSRTSSSPRRVTTTDAPRVPTSTRRRNRIPSSLRRVEGRL